MRIIIKNKYLEYVNFTVCIYKYLTDPLCLLLIFQLWILTSWSATKDFMIFVLERCILNHTNTSYNDHLIVIIFFFYAFLSPFHPPNNSCTRPMHFYHFMAHKVPKDQWPKYPACHLFEIHRNPLFDLNLWATMGSNKYSQEFPNFHSAISPS